MPKAERKYHGLKTGQSGNCPLTVIPASMVNRQQRPHLPVAGPKRIQHATVSHEWSGS